MPSITKAKLDDLEASLASTARLAKTQEDRATAAEVKLRSFDAVLDKVVRAAQGRPLSDDRNGGYLNAGYGLNTEPWRQQQSPPLEERQAEEIRVLNERIVGLESRLAAVVAVAQFAKEHKA